MGTSKAPRTATLLAAAGLLCAAAGCAPALSAPPHLVAAWPMPGASLPVEPTTLELTFNRPLAPETASASVWREDDGLPLASEAVIDGANPRRLSVRLPAPEGGAYRLHWHAAAARTGAAADGEEGFSMWNESSVPPRLNVSQPTVEAGEKLHLEGSGFASVCHVEVTIADDNQALAEIDTDARGALSADVPVPSWVPFGVQPVGISDSQCGTASTAVQVRWGGWPPLVSSTAGQSGPRAGQVTFSVTVRNRSDYMLEHVRAVLSDPAAAAFLSADNAGQHEENSVVWELPTVDRGVFGPLRATYQATSAVVGRTWLQFRHRKPRGCKGEECLPAFVSESRSESAPVAPVDITPRRVPSL